MRFVTTIFWGFVLSAIVAFVLTSMSGDPFSLSLVCALTVLFSAAVYIFNGILTVSDNDQ